MCRSESGSRAKWTLIRNNCAGRDMSSLSIPSLSCEPPAYLVSVFCFSLKADEDADPNKTKGTPPEQLTQSSSIPFIFSRVSADILKQPSGCQKEIVKEISNLPRTQWTSDPQVLVTSQSPSNMLLLPGDCNCLFDRAQDPTTGAAELPVEVIRVVNGETTRATLPLSTWWGGSS